MKALAVRQDTGELNLVELSEPVIGSAHQVKLKILEVGICGTDREQVLHGISMPSGEEGLVIGHEVLGQVVETGAAVSRVSPGDLAVMSVRRGCGSCSPCRNGRSDMCATGRYKERGIKGLRGFDMEYVVDEERYVVRVPPALRPVGVLTEPLSVAEKAIDQACLLQAARLPEMAGEDWLAGRRVLVAGLGPVGLLAAMALRLRGAEVLGLDVVDEAGKRPSLLKQLGGSYLDGRRLSVKEIEARCGELPFIFEAAGVAQLGFDLIDLLGINGVYVMTGIPRGERPVSLEGAGLMNQIVMKNQLVLGSVNAAPKHFAMAIQDLEKACRHWGSLIEGFITTRIPYTHFHHALELRSDEDIKTVIAWV